MDSLTQIILGGAIGNAIAGKKLKNKAVLYGAIAGTIPDLDVLAILFTDPISALEIHRGFSHSLIFAIFGSLLFGYLVYLLEKKKGLTFKEAVGVFFWGFVTHSLLDVFTTWGTRILWPFDYPFAFKAIFVIDPLYTLPFMFFLIRSMFEKNNIAKRIYWNKLGLIVSTAYLFVALLLKGIAFYAFTSALKEENVVYTSISVKPTIGNTILWNGIVETRDSFLIGEYSFFDHSSIQFKSYPKNLEYGEKLENNKIIGRLIQISEGYYTFSENENEIYFNDLRFGLLKNDGEDLQFAFSYRFVVDDNGKLTVEEVKKERKDGVLLLKKLWKRLKGI
jgi:inner membrane protein